MTNAFNTIVIGTGSMGSATCYYLAKRGQKVLGIDQFEPPHERGSHGGQSRIIRKAYFEHADYVPLLERAYENWRSLEMETGTELFYRTGIVYFGKPDNANIVGIRNSAVLHNIHIENLSYADYGRKYPAFDVPADFDAIFEPDAGFVTPEAAISTYIRGSEKLGAVILRNTPVLKWSLEGNRVKVVTEKNIFTADKLVITAGAWASQVLPQLKVKLEVTRQLLAWVEPQNSQDFLPGNFPCWFVEDPELGTFYGFPYLAGDNGPVGLKLAHHFPGVPSSPEEINDPLPAVEKEKLRHFLLKYIPTVGDNIIHTRQCLYTNSPDGHFIIDHLPDYRERVTIACGFSGHGFKFVPVVGEVLADLAMTGTTAFPIDFLKLKV